MDVSGGLIGELRLGGEGGVEGGEGGGLSGGGVCRGNLLEPWGKVREARRRRLWRGPLGRCGSGRGWWWRRSCGARSRLRGRRLGVRGTGAPGAPGGDEAADAIDQAGEAAED